MADNVQIKDFNGVAATILSDEITTAEFGTGQVQIMKVMGSNNAVQKIDQYGVTSVRQDSSAAYKTLVASGEFVEIYPNSDSAVAFQISGTFVGTLVFEGSCDGSAYAPLYSTANGSSTQVTQTTTPGLFFSKCGGLAVIRVRFSVRTSGSPSVTIRIGQGTNNVTIDAPVNVAAGTSYGTARTANPAAVANGVVTAFSTDKLGRQVAVLNQIRELSIVQATTITNSTSATAVLAAAGASVFHDITHLDVSNGSASPTSITLSDGTINQVFNVPAGGGFVCDYNTPLKATTANTPWTVTCGTSVASLYVNIVAVKNL